MSKQPKIKGIVDLNLVTFVSNEDLMQELMSRYDQIIIIRENRKESGIIDIKVKTCRGKLCKPKDEFDIFHAQDLLLTAQEHLLRVYMGAEQEDNEGSDTPQDAQEGG